MDYVLRLDQLDRTSVPIAGGKGANLVRCFAPASRSRLALWRRSTRHNMAAAEKRLLLEAARANGRS